MSISNGLLNSPDNTSTCTDDNGGLLFYTDGEVIFNSAHLVMENGSNIGGDNNGGQCVLVVPQPLSSLYYVFTVGQWASISGFSYSIVDLSLNDGLGSVISSGNTLLDISTERIASVYDIAGDRYWILTHGWNTNEFFAYELNSSGLQTEPVVSAIGSVLSGGMNSVLGQLTISEDGSRVANALYENDLFELFEFDINSGQLSNPISISGFDRCWGTAFSPNNEFLYVTEWYNDKIWQLDLSVWSTVEIENSIQLVGEVSINGSTNGYEVGYLQLAPNEKIYAAKFGQQYISSIEFPNESGQACGFIDNSIQLTGTCKAGLSRGFVRQSCPLNVSFEFSEGCNGDSIQFTDLSQIGISGEITYFWDFGDSSGTSTEQNPVYYYQSPGEYTVSLIVESDLEGCMGSYEATLTYGEEFPQNLAGPDQVVCSSENVEIGTEPIDGYNYTWSPDILITDINISNPSILALESIAYYLEIVDISTGCSVLDSVYIEVFAAPSIDFDLEVDICQGDTFQIGPDPIEGFTYSWSPTIGVSDSNSANPSVIYSGVNNYQVIIEDSSSSCISVAEVNINLSEDIGVELISSSEAICFGDSVILQAIGNSPVVWNTGDSSYVITVFPQEDQHYSVEMMGSCGVSADSITILVAIPNEFESVPELIDIPCGSFYELTDSIFGLFSVFQGGQNLCNSCSEYILYPYPDVIYNVISVDQFGCESSVILNFQFTADVELFIPNVFTPNGDEFNEYFQISNVSDQCVKDCQLKVFNRWGNLIWNTRSINGQWSGKVENSGDSDVPEGSYFWTLSLELIDGQTMSRSGFVTLFR